MMALVAMAAVIASCSDDGYWEKYQEDGVKYSFTQATQNNSLDATATEVTVQVTRSTTKGSVELPITVETENTELKCPATVTFADGSAVADYTITFADLVVGETYVATLVLDEASVAAGGKQKCKVSVKLNYNWVSLGEGQFEDYFLFENPYKVEILQAEGFPVYRVMKPYDEGMVAEGYVEAGYAGATCDYIEVTIDDDGLAFYDGFATGYLYQASADYPVWAWHPSAFSKLADPEYWQHNLQLDEKHIQLAPYYYIDGVGGWNQTQADGVIIITLP